MPEAIAKTVGSKRRAPKTIPAATVKKAKAKQTALPGLENRDIPEIEEAAERYRDIRDDRIAMSRDEAEAKQSLIEVMKKHNRTVYTHNGLSVTLEEIDNVKVKAAKKADEEEEE